jgi:hypothetical protein
VASCAAGGVGGGAAMSWTEVVLGILGGIVVPIITFYLGRRSGRREREEDRFAEEARDRDRRGDQVVQAYVGLVNSNYTGGLHGLLLAGVKNLRSSDEIRLARERAAAQTGGILLASTPSKTRI